MRKLLDETLEKGMEPIVEAPDGDEQDVLKQIDWVALEKLISDQVGVAIKIVSEIDNVGGYIKWKSQELVDEAGVLKAGLKTLRIAVFNSLTPSEMQQKGYYWCTGHYAFTLASGGSNGISLFTAWYQLEQKKWDYKKEESSD